MKIFPKDFNQKENLQCHIAGMAKLWSSKEEKMLDAVFGHFQLAYFGLKNEEKRDNFKLVILTKTISQSSTVHDLKAN